MNRLPQPWLWLSLILVFWGPAVGQEQRRPEQRLQPLLNPAPHADGNAVGALPRQEDQADRNNLAGRKPVFQVVSRFLAAGLKPTHANVSYGPHKRNVLDLYLAESATPTPLVIYIHGGGFVAGDKSHIDAKIIRSTLDAGMSFASINYRFVDGKDVLFPAPQHDGARAVQFLRSKAQEWNLDPNRVACFGGSAGAGISLWIGFHDDLADPQSSDPVLRQSTRIQAIGTLGGQGTYDPVKIKELIGGRAWEHPSLLKVYGLRTLEEALHPTPEKQKLYDEASAITHLTKDDPPLFMVYGEDDPNPPNAQPGAGIHHVNFGKQLKTQMDALGIENVLVYLPEAKGRDVAKEMIDFFRKQFAKRGSS